jgi:hypothetical protein
MKIYPRENTVSEFLRIKYREKHLVIKRKKHRENGETTF